MEAARGWVIVGTSASNESGSWFWIGGALYPGHAPTTYRKTSDEPEIYRVSYDGVEIGSISLQTRHVDPVKTYWHWGIDTMPMIAGRTPDGDIHRAASKTR